MLRAVAFETETVSQQVQRWLAEMDELLDELRAGHHTYAVRRMAEAADFGLRVLRPCLLDELATIEQLDAFLDLVWRRRLALVTNETVQARLAELLVTVRDRDRRAGWPEQPPVTAEEQDVSQSLRDTNGAIHAAIDDHLARHLTALTALDFAAASAAWELLTAELHAHADTEDELVVPLYDQLGHTRPGGQPAMFLAEHNGIRRLLGKLAAQQASLRGQRDVRRAVVDGLDRYLMLRHLLEHHTLREQNILYHELEAHTDEATLGRLRTALVEARPWRLLEANG